MFGEIKSLKLRQIATLILWACLASSVILAAIAPVELSLGAVFEVDSESSDLFDQIETEDDFLPVTVTAASVASLLLLGLGAMPLYFRTAHLSPLFPPPKSHLL